MIDRIRPATIAALLGILTLLAPATLPAGDVATAEPAAKDELIGDWQGTLTVGEARLRLVFRLWESDDGPLDATIDSPDQGATGIPVESVMVEGDSFTLDVSAIGATYAGKLTADREAIDGEWRQSGRAFPLKVERIDD
jgi:hypothetical protein